MDDNDKKIITCPKCGREIPIPSDVYIHSNKHIRFACPNGDHKFEYFNGKEVINLETKVINEDGSETVQKSTSQRAFPKGWQLVVIASIIGSLIFLLNPSAPDPEIEDQFPSITQTASGTQLASDTLFPFDITSAYGFKNNKRLTGLSYAYPPAFIENDSAFSAAINDFLLDRLEDLLDIIKDEIINLSKQAKWEEDTKWHQPTTQTTHPSGKNTKERLEMYKSRQDEVQHKITSITCGCPWK